MSWSVKIVVLYLGFVGIILTLVFTCFNHKTELEYKDYYARELHYQDQIDALANTEELSVPIDYRVYAKSLEILIPEALRQEGMTGIVQLMRPSDSSLDREFKIATAENGTQLISDPSFKRGVYKMNISIKCENKNYFKQAVIHFK
jgi:hypothetical protein